MSLASKKISKQKSAHIHYTYNYPWKVSVTRMGGINPYLSLLIIHCKLYFRPAESRKLYENLSQFAFVAKENEILVPPLLNLVYQVGSIYWLSFLPLTVYTSFVAKPLGVFRWRIYHPCYHSARLSSGHLVQEAYFFLIKTQVNLASRMVIDRFCFYAFSSWKSSLDS